MNKSRILIVCIFLIPALIMCSRKKEYTPTEEEIKRTEEALVGANRVLLQKDKVRIAAYIDSMNLDLRESQTGLWFQINDKGKGPETKEGSVVTISYDVSLLDGTKCYNSDSLGYKQFRVGHGGAESGLDEGIRMLGEGGDAIFILPPHLAHGLTGDGNCIPARSVIVYHVKLVKVEP